MKIKILGAGCYNCQALEAAVFNVLAELDIAADVEKVNEASKISEHGVLGMPALLINDCVKVYGRVPRIEEIKTWIQEHADK